LVSAAEDSNKGSEVELFPASLPKDSMHVDGIALPDGTWWTKVNIPDPGFILEAKRDMPIPYNTKAVERHVEIMWSDAEGIAVTEFPELAKKLTYPVFKASFLTGRNEDTRRHVGAFVFTDNWTFWFDVSASADADFTDKEETDTDGGRLVRKMETLLMTVDFLPKGEQIVPDIGIPVIIMGKFIIPGMDLSVLDAVLRVAKMAYPEVNHDPGMLAYRYDGEGEVNGVKARLFSFGSDSREKFTAERHFAVDNRGIVYEMKVIDGHDYVPVVDSAPKYWEGDDVPNWWGEYQDGDKTMMISSFRAGPVYYYVLFSFEIAGETVGEGVAAIDYNNVGTFCNLNFHLESGDNMVRVELTPNPPCDDETWTSRFAGSYRQVVCDG
jgi:hypothetical protein